MKDSSLNFTFVMVFSITVNEHTVLLPVWPSFAKIFQVQIETGTVVDQNKIGQSVTLDFFRIQRFV
jgi:hypothetical protein